MSIKLVIQIPVFNEERDIEATLEGIPNHINGVDFIETIIINDGSTDKTVQIIQNHNIKHTVNLPGHCGLGKAFREGLKYAYSIGADIIVNTDGDNQYPGYEIHRIIKPILDGKADMVIGSRQFYKISGYPLWKLIFQSVANFLVSRLLHAKIKDTTSGFRAFTRDSVNILIKKLKNDYTYTLESICLLIKKKKQISFMPINIRYPTRKSKLITNKIFYIKDFLVTLVRYYILISLKK